MRILLKQLMAFLLPGGAILLAVVAVTAWPGVVPGALQPLVGFAPFLTLVTGVLLGLFFHRSRIVFGVLVVAMAMYALKHGSAAPGRAVLIALSYGVPLNFLALALLPERGVFTKKGLLVLGALIVQAVLLVSLTRPRLLPPLHVVGMGTWPSWPMSSPALLVSGGVALFFAVRAALRPNAIDRAFCWATVGFWLSLEQSARPHALLLMMVPAVTLALSVLQATYAMAYHDELTGLPGRRAFHELLLRLGEEYTIAIVDVDHFKSFNDRYGHDVGDQVLRMVAARLSRVSGGGQAFRYGGEEFVLIFPGMPLEKALPHLEQVRSSVADTPFSLRGRWRATKRSRGRPAARIPRGVSVTVSIGAAARTATRSSPEQVIKAADQALYRAKAAGRNQVIS